MQTESFLKKLQEYKIFSQKEYHSQAFSRNIGLFSEQEQERLATAKIAIPGMGGVGGVHFMTMVRTGIGRFNISDFDIYEPANVNRQFGARVPDFGRSKMEVMKEQALSVNPYIDINEFPHGINKDTVDEFLEGVDVVLDSLDFFAFDARRLLFNRAREKGVYVITAGPLGFSSAMLIFAPDKGMGFDEYFNIVKGMKSEEQYLAFALGLAPQATQFKYMDTSKLSFKSKKGPSLNIACQLCSAMAGTEVVRILLNRGGIKPVPYYFQFDPYAQKYCRGKLFMGNRNPLQRIKSRFVIKMLKQNENSPFVSLEPEIPQKADFDNGLSYETIKYIIQAGIQAPSGDNAQPWKFAVSENKISLYLDKNADNSFFNIDQIASMISCGAVIENIKIAGKNLGIQTQVNYLPDTEDMSLMADLILSPMSKTDSEKDHLFKYLWKRHTNRKLYDQTPVPPSILASLKKEALVFKNSDIHFLTQKTHLKKLSKIIYRADQVRTLNRSLHEHFISMLRYTDKDIREKRDGLPLKNLEAGLAGELFLKATRSWDIMNAMNKLGISKLVSLNSYRGIINSAGVVLVTVNGFDNPLFLEGGRCLERIWIAMNSAGLSVQPMTAITLFWLRWQRNGMNDFSEQNRKILSSIWNDFQELFPGVNFERNGLIMLLRFGVSKPVSMGTLRKKYEQFILK